ncbi:MAG: tetratricopeptide repeat protein [Planctomycetes bacterium]|nr:tetratricopeptide repeat protein [Planctomycetota bacterium]
MKPSLLKIFLAGLLTLLFCTPLSAQSALQDSPPIPEKLRIALLDGDYREALRDIRNLQKDQPELTGFWYYLEGVAQQRAGNRSAAIEAFEQVEQNYGEGPWVHKACFHHAEALSAAGDWQGAEAIWESEVSWLRGAERQRELASIYFDLADGFSEDKQGAAGLEASEFQSAIVLYRKGLELDIPADQRRYAMGRVAWCFKQLKDWGSAVQAYRQYTDEFEDSGASFEYGQALRNHGSMDQARRVYEDLAASLDDSRDNSELEHLRGMAMYSIGYTYDRNHNGRNRAIGAFRRFLQEHPRHEKSVRAAYGIAQMRLENSERLEAIQEFETFLAMEAPVTDSIDELEHHQKLRQKAHFIIANTYIATGDYVAGRNAFARYVSLFPEGADWSASQRGIIDAEYSLARRYESDHEWELARGTYVKFLTEHPLDNRVREILYRLGDLPRLHAQDLEEDLEKLALFEQAISEWQRLIVKYPTSDEASRALYMTGFLREQEMDDLEGAVESYQACNFGSYQFQASERLRAMIKPLLAINTERAWRSDEAASFELDLRNVEAVQVEIYQLDLEAYFRKHLSITRIEDLDLDLIAADQEFEVAIDKFERFRPYTRTVELPVDGVGVWAVVVSSKDKRATTLVMRSDIDIIVKSSRKNAFIFAEDMRNQKGASGVELVVALEDGGKEVTEMVEVKTGRDGVAQIDFEELGYKDVRDVRVFAKDKRGVASTSTWVGNTGVAHSLEPSGFVFTEASAYQPGAMVSWRAVLREVDEGVFTFKKGEQWRVTMVDSSGRVVHRESLPLSDFGSLNGEARLSAGALPGRYMVRCESPSGRVHTSHFVVQEFKVKRIEIEMDLDRDVYYRGEQIEFELAAKYSYGEAVADAALQVIDPAGKRHDVRTDNDGKFTLTFDTRSLDNTGTLYFQATLVEENVHASVATLLSATGFRIGLGSMEDVYLLGRDIPLPISAFAPDGTQVERGMKLRLMRRYADDFGRWVDEEVSSQEVITKDEGRLMAQLVPEKGGFHFVSLEGTDRFGNPVTARKDFFVSGQDDDTKLRLLSDAGSLEVGGKMPLEVVNRAGNGLLLVTFEGGSILDYRLVPLSEGVHQLDIDVPDKFFPDLLVTINMMHGDDFYQAQRGFSVTRNLVVTMKPRKDIVHPGETVEVDIEVVNQLGEPVSTELSFAAVDASLFELHPDASGNILNSFRGYGQRREAFRTYASNEFFYSGVTTDIAAALLEEDERLKAEKAWAEGKDRATDKLRKSGEYKGPGDSTPPSSPGAPSSQAARGRLSADAPMEGMELEELGYVSNDAIGISGGAGGRYGGRGGKKSLRREQGAATYFGGKFAYAESASKALVGQVDEEIVDALTATWQPSIRTDRKGKATVTFTAPQLSTRWRLMCRGVDKGSAVGQSTASVITRADFMVELRTPSIFLEGDQASVIARAHNMSGMAGDVDLVLELNYPSGKQLVEETLHFDGSDVQDLQISLPSPVPGNIAADVVVSLSASGEFRAIDGNERFQVLASTKHDVPVVPWGLAVADQHSGQLVSDSAFILQLPNSAYASPSWSLHIGLGIDQMLIEEALNGSAPYLRSGHSLRYDGPLRNPGFAGELQGVLGVLNHMRDTRKTEHPAYAALLTRANGLVTTLLATQQSKGGWAWSSRNQSAQAEVTARVMIALEAAQEFGLDLPQNRLGSGRSFMRNSLSSADKQLPFTRAILIYALSLSDSVEFGLANSLHRSRANLSPAAAAYTALALGEMGSDSMAKEMLEVSLRRETTKRIDTVSWCSSPVELQALLLTTCLRIDPAHSAIPELEQALMSQRPWYGNGAHGMALAAISSHRTVSGLNDRDAQVTVSINGGKSETFKLGPKQTSIDLHGMVGLIDGAPNVQFNLKLKGRGKPHFTATLEGFDTQPKENEGDHLKVWRTYLMAAPTMYNGREYQPGFSSVDRSLEQWRNEITQLEYGTAAPMYVSFRRESHNGEVVGSQDFITLEIPLPAGAHVVEDSVTGNYESWMERNGRLFVDVGRTRSSGNLQFRMRGLVPGKYRLLPVTVHSAYDRSLRGVGATRDLEVLPRGQFSNDQYRTTPDELYSVGVAAYLADDKGLAWDQLNQLDEEFGKYLRTPQLLESSRIMLELAIDRNDANRMVRYFEILKEKNPSLTVTFARMSKIAQAYRDLGEFERSARIFAAVAEETFSMDLQVVAVLEQQNNFHDATEALHRFWMEYPDFPRVVETALTLADRLMQAAPEAHRDRSLRLAQRDRAVLLYESVTLLKRFLSLYADDPTAPDAALNMVSAYLDLEDFENASRLSAEFAARYEEPRFNDAFVYTQAVAEWTMGNDKKSMKLLQGIADAVYKDANGRESHSENRELALYILGQIHHAKRDFVSAATYYEKVSTVFADAGLVLEGFRRRGLMVDEVTEVSPGEKAKFELHYRNIQEAELLVYPVDLMTLYLREKNLAGITSVNLAGIEPVIRRSLKLPDNGSMRQQDHEVELKLPEAGAYLVICRADTIHASGMVLVSDFELEVANVGPNGVRVQAVDREDGHYLRDVDVRVIGSYDSNFISGRTDPRGLYLADGFNGPATVIARHSGRHYAFYRGAGAGQLAMDFDLGLEGMNDDSDGMPQQMLDNESYFDNVRGFNDLQQQERSRNLEQQQKSKSQGLELNKLQ